MCMNRNDAGAGSAKADFIRVVRELYPVAHGTLSLVNKRCSSPYCRACKSGEGHPSWIFTFRRDGRQHCMHVQPRHVETVRRAIENGRRLEESILDEGISLLGRLRGEG